MIWKYLSQILLVRFLLCELVTEPSLNGCFDARALPQQLLHPPSWDAVFTLRGQSLDSHSLSLLSYQHCFKVSRLFVLISDRVLKTFCIWHFFFWDSVLWIPGSSWTCYIAKDNLKLFPLLSAGITDTCHQNWFMQSSGFNSGLLECELRDYYRDYFPHSWWT